MAWSLPSFEDLYQRAACGLLLTGADGTIHRANRTFAEWTGFESVDLTGRSLQTLLTPRARFEREDGWGPMLDRLGKVEEVAAELLHREGQTIPVIVNAVRRADSSPVLDELAVFPARENRRLAGHVFDVAGHDLRNPLAAIQMSAAVLERTELDERQRAGVARIARSASRAQNLISNLLDLTAVRIGGGLWLEPKPIDVQAVVAGGVDALRKTYPGRVIELLPSGSGALDADADRLVQLLTLLVANAMSYGVVDGPVRIVSALESRRLVLSVQNDGDPIGARLRPHLFEPVTRDSVASQSRRGVALGLFIARQICRAHGGDLVLAPSPAAPTTFTATLSTRDGVTATDGR